MCAKRSLSVLADTEVEQENQPKITAKSLCQHTSTEFAGLPDSVLSDSLSTQRKNNSSKFEKSWLALNTSCIGQNLMDFPENTSSIMSPTTKVRTKALPISILKSSPRTPPAISRTSCLSSFQTSRRWNTLMNEESSHSLKRKSPLTSPLMLDKCPPILSSSFKTSRLWSELVSEESAHKINDNSSKSSPLIEKTNTSPQSISSALKTSQRWNDLMSGHLLNESNCADESHEDSLPVIRLVPDQPSQYLPPSSSSQKRVTPKSHIRAVKGGYADSFQRLLKSVRMDQRHLSSREPTHRGLVLAITEEFNVTMALVEAETQPGSSRSCFNILLQPNQSKNLKVGSKLQFYLDPNIKPLELSNRQLVFCQPHNVTVL